MAANSLPRADVSKLVSYFRVEYRRGPYLHNASLARRRGEADAGLTITEELRAVFQRSASSAVAGLTSPNSCRSCPPSSWPSSCLS